MAQTAQADTLVMRSGEKKTGKIIEENETHVLFKQPGGVVADIPKSAIAIFDREFSDKDLPKKNGFVSLFSTTPRKDEDTKKYALLAIGDSVGPKKSPVPRSEEKMALPKGDADRIATFQKMQDILEHWMSAHPEWAKNIQGMMDKFKGKSGDLDELVVAAKKSQNGG